MSGKIDALRNRILADISGGQLPVDSRIPSRNQLALKYGFSRSTVDRTVNGLIAEGRLRGEQGRGTFVLPAVKDAVRRLHIVCPVQSIDMYSSMQRRFFRGRVCPVPMEVVPEEEVQLRLGEMSRPGGAVIWYCPSMYMLSGMRALRQAYIPQLLVNRDFPRYDSVCTDQLETMRDALTWLMIEGGRDVAMVSFEASPERPYLYDRILAFYRCAAQLGARIGASAVHCRSFTDLAQEIVETARQLLDGGEGMRSVAVLQRDLLLPFVTCGLSMGKEPGRDYRLFCFDYVPKLRNYEGICMVQQRFPYMAQMALQWLEDRCRGGRASFRKRIKGELCIGRRG